jgi:hypothetical protein
MCHRQKYNEDRYGDGDVPDVDVQPYRDNAFDPHPEASGDNEAYPEPLPESSRERRDGPGGE